MHVYGCVSLYEIKGKRTWGGGSVQGKSYLLLLKFNPDSTESEN